MINFFPESALASLEFDKVKTLLSNHCQTGYAKEKAAELRIHTRLDYIDRELRQTHEYKAIIDGGLYFPNDPVFNLSKELKLLGIPGAVLAGEQFLQLKKMSETTQAVFRWFDEERKQAYTALYSVIAHSRYEKKIVASIDEVLDENGQVKDSASRELASIRQNLYRKKGELRRVFDKVLSRLNKAGYIAEIEESFLSGRRVVALFAEHKRQVKGILHGESDSRKTAFIEPEETIELNNAVFELENEERREVYKILRELTARLSEYGPLLADWHQILGEYDFIAAKAKLAIEIHGQFPTVADKAQVHLVNAFHPLLYLYNRKLNKPTMPVTISLDDKRRILVISGPNAGGKTVTLKTIGLLQIMLQSGLLVPVHPSSQFGVFKQLMIHIGDTQSLEFELSTYSSHLLNMKHFIENVNGKTLFLIDELGSGSDPNLGGAFAEVILEEMARKHAIGVVTTHYLNLKVMANKTAGIINGAMAFDEKNLLPLYTLMVGKPGSSYTFSIAERIGLPAALIQRARGLVEDDHFSLDKLLNRAEQDMQRVEKEKIELQKLLRENERLRKQMEQTIKAESHKQQVEMMKEQNKISEERILYLKDMERKLRQLVFEWRKAEEKENKDEVIKQMRNLLLNQKEKQVKEKAKKNFDSRYIEIGGAPKIGDKAMMKQNRQVGVVKEIRGKKAIVQLGIIPITVELNDLVVVKDKPDPRDEAA